MGLIYQALILAQNGPAPQAEDPNGLVRMILPLLMIMVLFYFLLLRPQKKKDEDFRRMVSDLKENDHVVTVGGIHGVVTNVQRDAERVTIRVDDATGTKLRVTAASIARVITDEDSGSESGGSGKSK
jgi:preprotein translocase subunit YajC